MKKAILVAIILSITFLGCQTTKTRAVEGGVIGGVLGAGAGYAIGQTTHHGAEGAGIGAAIGAISGAIIGSQIEKPQSNPITGSSSQISNPNQMSLQQIVELTKQGIDEDVIIDRIRLTNSKFNLTAEDIAYLQKEGVSARVIAQMQK
ncbi:MAG: glycine zipper domain-containing protein [Candidatus Omnitrophica bacterium]|nr:glycine zipper domain-containing protein [Candidatus Omnitrophota bacterium]